MFTLAVPHVDFSSCSSSRSVVVKPFAVVNATGFLASAVLSSVTPFNFKEDPASFPFLLMCHAFLVLVLRVCIH